MAGHVEVAFVVYVSLSQILGKVQWKHAPPPLYHHRRRLPARLFLPGTQGA